jgi:hypothetical protein
VMLFAIGCSGDPEKCEKAVRNYHSLLFWEAADKEIGSAAPAEREAKRAEEQAQFKHEEDRALPTLVSQCQAANNTDQMSCLIAAKTAAQARKCADQAEMQKK